MNARDFLIAMVASLCMSACEHSDKSSVDLSAAQSTLNDNIALWQRSNIPNYRYTYRRNCFCAPEESVVVVVANGQVSEAFRTPSGTYLSAQELTSVFPVEGLFSKVQEAINKRAFNLTVVYHSQFGFPASISIDYNQNIADDELNYTARDFQ